MTTGMEPFAPPPPGRRAPTVSVQPYSLREAGHGWGRTLRTLREGGYTALEPFHLGSAESAALAAQGLSQGYAFPTAHARIFDGGFDAALAAAQAMGVELLIEPHVDRLFWQDADGIAHVAGAFTSLSERASDCGVQIGYHHHEFEIESRIGGVTALEVFADAVGDSVKLQYDPFWVQATGASSTDLLARLGERVASMHLKDGFGEQSRQVPLGRGELPIRELIEAALPAQLVIAFDDPVPVDVFVESLAFLSRFTLEPPS